jgi:hypothetical protein
MRALKEKSNGNMRVLMRTEANGIVSPHSRRADPARSFAAVVARPSLESSDQELGQDRDGVHDGVYAIKLEIKCILNAIEFGQGYPDDREAFLHGEGVAYSTWGM